jgi:predicted MFS family arabinose efflux permease
MNFMKNYFVLILVGFAGFISAADNWVASLLLPSMSEDFAISISQASIVLTAYLIPYGVLQPVYGYYSDRYGRKKILLLLMFFLSLSTLLCAIAPTIILLTVCRFITGLFAAGIIAVSLGILGELYKKEILTKLVGLFLGLIFLGQGLSSAVGGWLIEISNWRNIFILFSILSLLSFLSIFFLPSSGFINTQKSAFIKALFSLLKKSTLRKIYFIAFCNGFIVLGTYSYIGAYFSTALGVDYKYVGVGLMLFGIVCFLTGFLNRLLLKDFSNRKILMYGFSCSIMSLLLLICHNIILTYIATMLLGMGYILVQSILASRALDLALNDKGLSSGIIGVAIFGGGGIGTYLGSLVLNISNYQILFLLFLCLIVVPLLISMGSKDI